MIFLLMLPSHINIVHSKVCVCMAKIIKRLDIFFYVLTEVSSAQQWFIYVIQNIANRNICTTLSFFNIMSILSLLINLMHHCIGEYNSVLFCFTFYSSKNPKNNFTLLFSTLIIIINVSWTSIWFLEALKTGVMMLKIQKWITLYCIFT